MKYFSALASLAILMGVMGSIIYDNVDFGIGVVVGGYGVLILAHYLNLGR